MKQYRVTALINLEHENERHRMTEQLIKLLGNTIGWLVKLEVEAVDPLRETPINRKHDVVREKA